MSKLVIPNSGETAILTEISNYMGTDSPTLRLFSNNYTVIASSEISNYTEASFDGYVGGALLTNPNVSSVGGKAVCTWDQVQFTMGATPSTITIYGYWVAGTTKYYWAENIGPYTLGNTGDYIYITPKLSLYSEP